MPLEAYSRRLAVEITGRQKWSAGRGPEIYSGRQPLQLLCDFMFKGQDMVHKPVIGLVNKPFKKLVSLDPEREFFSASEILSCKPLNALLQDYSKAREIDSQAQATRDQRQALDAYNSANRILALAGGEQLALIPGEPGKTFLNVGLSGGSPGTEQVRTALQAFATAYTTNGNLNDAAAQVRRSIDSIGKLPAKEARAVSLELFYDSHNPWRMTEYLYGLAIILFGLSTLCLRKPLITLAIIATAGGVIEHMLGIGLRIAILDRAPVSNTFEALLWMGLVGIAVGLIAQILNKGGYYLFGGVCAALASVLFAAMVPLTDRTNSLPAVLRSNYWLIIHVLTIVASYGVLLVSAILGHVYLAREVLFAKRAQTAAPAPKLSHPLIAQTYRTIQIGLLLLTAGTILGGVWAADSWGRFWGWDPKETWALISIVVYFAVLHARYVRWLQDFGLAASAVLGFVVIVWTFYGVNYVMATGLHSYGFGSGGEIWVGLWAAAEIVFLIACKVRYSMLNKAAPTPAAGIPATT
ncbi:Cytochrome c biogenesis protein CcsA [Phycisphaerales bacterium]|nr:Cytochrome c biogenesis protein CcsA [Phycisphaerales bacterium]